MTHRVFSRNAGSSRARPSATIIKQVRDAPWGPIHWGANQPGMQAHRELDEDALRNARGCWKNAAVQAASAANYMMAQGAHKQIVNRLLEPFTYIDVLITSTEYANWFALRDHKDAQPEIQEVARLMKTAMDASTPKLLQPGEWHLPYIEEFEWDQAYAHCKVGRITRDEPTRDEMTKLLIKVSVARCARVSYKAFDGTDSSIEADLALYDKLLAGEPLHASPAEHQATPDFLDFAEWDVSERHPDQKVWSTPEGHGNFVGWIQYRKTLPNEFVPG